jgi:hypothetical protein
MDDLLLRWIVSHPHRLMRNGPHKPTRRPPPEPAQGDDENRAGIRALDCGEDAEPPQVIRRAEPPVEPQVPEPPPALGEQRQSL